MKEKIIELLEELKPNERYSKDYGDYMASTYAEKELAIAILKTAIQQIQLL